MLFNSIEFAIFLPIVFVLYWLCTKSIKAQNVLIVICSYFFYGYWDWRFLSLLFISTITDYIISLKIKNTINNRKRLVLLLVSVFVNLGFLGFFKYYNFFIDNFVTVFSLFGKKPNISSLQIILPVGISFYTFQTMSYTIDVYKNKMEPTKDFIAFAAFVSFFPQLVAGPIERAVNLLPQFYNKRTFEYKKAVDGMRQILWGLFKKIVVADSCAVYVNMAFGSFSGSYADPSNASLLVSGITLFLGAVFFSFQIYCDFSGYSDIAIGTARLFGFNLMRNFNFPYFSRDIAEFWRRWHISLTTWFRDYVYIPLGGSHVKKVKIIRNTFIIFLISGFWHGANWTFIIWGLLHAVLFLPLIILKKNHTHIGIVATGRIFPNLKEILQMGLTFLLVLIGWILFRAESIEHFIRYINSMIDKSLFSLSLIYQKGNALKIMFTIFITLFIEWLGRENKFGLEKFCITWNRPNRWIIYLIISLWILSNFNTGSPSEFIYFQF